MITRISHISPKVSEAVQYGLSVSIRALRLHCKISTASFFLGITGYLAYRTWSKLTGSKSKFVAESGIDKVKTFTLFCFVRLVNSNVLNPSACHLTIIEDKQSIRESAGTNTAFFKLNKKHDYLLFRLLRITARFATLTAISTVAAPCGVGWNGSRLIDRFVFSSKAAIPDSAKRAFNQDLMMTLLIPSHLFLGSIMAKVRLNNLVRALSIFLFRKAFELKEGSLQRLCGEWAAKVGTVIASVLIELINRAFLAIYPALLTGGLALLYLSSIDIKNYIFALSPSLKKKDLQVLLKSVFLRQYFGLTGPNGNLLVPDLVKDQEKFTFVWEQGFLGQMTPVLSQGCGHLNDLMNAMAWQLLTKLEETQNRLPQNHKLSADNLTSKNTLISHLKQIPGLKKTGIQDNALSLAEDTSLVTDKDVEELDQLWSTLDQLRSLFKDIIEIGLNKSDLVLHTLHLASSTNRWKTVGIPLFYQLKLEYIRRFHSIPLLTPKEKDADNWHEYLTRHIKPELCTDDSKFPPLAYTEFLAVKKQVTDSKTSFECLGLLDKAPPQAVNKAWRACLSHVHPDKAGVCYPQTHSHAAAALTCALNRAKDACLPARAPLSDR